ncbi:alpha-2-macroglobulin family protein [Wenyingzhuangia aestuarii]|uniref:alpha-2-macroglobulin family protein n=1 Tax=Wenyingzhuangia aestuarii TaxID=1647582 RepID=UPI00143A93E2|nr:alpha-2-macroglobulin family protein [Wenyingzhuangia aestuarii]NJB82080.1 TonB-dependent SusC/RagA subfamily outer membrane receptor [Wenyingzhuangia aestuarii]
MKKSILVVFLFLSCVLQAQSKFNSYDNLWVKVYEDELKLLPKSSLKKVDAIYSKAVKEKNEVQKIRCLLYQSKFALTLEENAQLKIVNNFKLQIKATNNKVSKALLHSLLGQMYLDYFQAHRWDFYNRTQTAKKVNDDDFRTWDLKTLYTEIHKHFNASLQEKELLITIKIDDYKVLIKENQLNEISTLFDFLVFNALDFYNKSESSITQPKEPFVIDKKEYLSEIETYHFSTTDSLSNKYLSLKLYQELIQFHKKQTNQEDYFKTLLLAVEYVQNKSDIEDFKQVKLTFLQKLQQKYSLSKARVYIDFEIAKTYYSLGETYNPKSNTTHQYAFKKALEICEELENLDQDHELFQKNKELINAIKSKEVFCVTEEYMPVNQQSKAMLKYRNVTEFYGTIYKVNSTQYQQIKEERVSRKKDSLTNLLPVYKEWKSELPNKNDYQQHSTEILLPKIPQGLYILKGNFIKNNKNSRLQYFQITNLTYLKKDKGLFQVLNRQTGRAYLGAKVYLKNKPYNTRESKIDKDFVTDENGFFEFENHQYYRNVTAKVVTKTDTAFFENIYLYNYNNYTGNTSSAISYKPFVFTDRSIYRPGQKVFFKAIVLKKKGKNTEVVSNESVEVVLYDVNNQQVKKATLELNEFGTVASTFELPTGGLNGQYSFKVFRNGKQIEYVSTKIAVEEYKRPKFETSFTPIKETYKVNDSVTVNGEAIALSGSKITNAKVVYRVVRKAKFPRWCWWGRPSNPTEIANGEIITDGNGDYKVKFKAFPDVNVDKKNQPTFYYTIYADVTDINGETRSAETEVAVGYHSLRLEVSLKNKIDSCDKNSLTIDSENLNGQFVAVQGELKIYKLVAPQMVYRNRPWSSPDVQTFSKEEYAKLFPFETYKEEDLDPKKWEKGKLVFSKSFDTEKEPKISLGKTKKWELGKYIVVATSKDKWGQLVKDEQLFTLLNSKAKKVADNQLFQISIDKEVYQPKDYVILSVSSSFKGMTVFVEVEKNHKTVSVHQIELNNQIKKIKIPVSEKDRGGFAIKWHRVNYNAIASGVLHVSVPYQPKDLSIETLTFRDLLQPGATQKWSFKIKGANQQKATAEVLASMYDVSLDQFKPHTWSFNPVQLPIYRTSNYINSFNNFRTNTLTIRSSNYRYFYHHYQLAVHQFNWFGFSFTNDSWVNRNYLREIKNYFFEFNNIQKSHNDSLAKDEVKITVVDANHEPLPGVTIVGGEKPILTGFDGVVILENLENKELYFSYLGYQKAILKIEKSYNSYVVVLEEDSKSLDEVVVVGYGTQKKKEVTGALQGQVSGVNIISTTRSEAEDNIQIRGMASLEAGDNPLYVVDGVVYDKDPQLNVDEISSIDVLKDGAATAIYGTRGANGVVIVTTKSGAKKLEEQLGNIKARTNFNETAFFFPQLKTDENGEVSFEFTMPEDLTKWKLQLLAHDKELNTGVKSLTTVTQKQLMVTPNAPRFLREGDEITFSTKIANLATSVQQGKVRLELTDPTTGKNIDALLQNHQTTKDFKVVGKGNTSVSWQLQIPENISAVQYKIVAASTNYSDGEQNVLPVLSNRMLVTETLPLWVNGGETKTFVLNGLKNNTSESLKHHQLTLEITSNPAWYAVQALPYLMEYPHECAEQTFARYYANQLASHILNSNPKIKKVFDQWANSETLISNLEKNQELKSIIIQETPWLRDAQSETEQKKRIALLFDLSKLENSLEQTINKLDKMQFSSGAFPWFSGSDHSNRYITQHILQGFAHLKHLGVNINHKKTEKIIEKAQAYVNAELLEDYERLLVRAENIKSKAKTKKEGVLLAQDYLNKKHLYSVQLQYLYIRSFNIQPITDKKLKEAVDYYFHQTIKYWKQESLYNKGLITLIQHRNNHLKTANNVLKSLEENSVTSDEMGMYWKENKASWYWYQSPIETQSLLIEVFSEVANNTKKVDELKKWLLKNKQTQQWKTTKATSEAIYALLLQGSDWLAEDTVAINIGGEKLEVSTLENAKVEAGTGYFKTKWKPAEINTNMATVTLTKKDKGVAWGGLYWQYFEDLDKIKTANTPLKLNKKVFVKTNTANGPLLTEVANNTTLKVADLLTVRIELSTDRAMEFIHMKDMRASGLEPVEVLSAYKWQDRLGYYQSTKDASTHFFFDRIDKGIYVFEYDLRVSHKGVFSNGITTIQSMYAPEFSSHSKGIRIEVK